MKVGEVQEHNLYMTFETKTGGIFATKVKPIHGV
jgi:hypothetical protein